MSQLPDVVDAVQAYLAADSAVAAVVATRIWPAETPESESTSMPRACVVVRLAGGWPSINDAPIEHCDVDLTCYGSTPKEARTVYQAAHDAMRNMGREVAAGVKLYSARRAGGPFQGREPDTAWPMVWSSWAVLASEQSTS